MPAKRIDSGITNLFPESIHAVFAGSADYILSGKRSALEALAFAEKFVRLSGEHQRIIGELVDSLIGV